MQPRSGRRARWAVVAACSSLPACSLLTDLGPLESSALDGSTDGSSDGSMDGSRDQDAAALRKRIFFTVGGYTGGLGGISGADSKCASVATSRSLGGTFVAWISDSKTDAHDRIVDVGPWYAMDRATLLFASKAALDYLPTNPITLDETGAAHDAATYYWTGTVLGGTKSSSTCLDWTGVASPDGGPIYGTAGAVGATDQRWTNDNADFCAYSYSLLCIEQ